MMHGLTNLKFIGSLLAQTTRSPDKSAKKYFQIR